MSDVYGDVYWNNEFEVTEADLDRISAYIGRTRQAHDLTTLAGRVVRGRLRHGQETSAPVQVAWERDASVRLWDPAGEWRAGEHVIVAYRVSKETINARFGEIVRIEPGQVKVQLDRVEQPVTYLRADAESNRARQWYAAVQAAIDAKEKASKPEERAKGILLAHSERVGGQLLEALRADDRFVRLAGRWLMRELALLATDEQLAALAWAIIEPKEPQATADLVDLVKPPLADGDPGLFGLYLAMRGREDLFANADPGQRPRWELAGPPPGTFTPNCAAYDPETYEILCFPDEQASPEAVEKLWEVDLLRAVV